MWRGCIAALNQERGQEPERKTEEVHGVKTRDAGFEEAAGGPAAIEALLVGKGKDEAAEEEKEVDGEVAAVEVFAAKELRGVVVDDDEGGDAAEGIEHEEFMFAGGCVGARRGGAWHGQV